MVMVATEGMERFFPQHKIVVTGNPVRAEISNPVVRKEEALEFFGMKEGRKTILVIGGSMGARSINQSIANGLDRLIEAGLQVIWQTGKSSEDLMLEKLKANKSVCITSFISKMHYAYMACDLVVSRSGAIALAEICAMGKPSILVPYPFAAEDHQTVNASNMSNHGACIAIKDAIASNILIDEILQLAKDEEKLKQFGAAAKTIYFNDADMNIANLIIETIKKSMTELNHINDIRKAYFVGIGGIGMSALARFLHARGVDVSGYDRVSTELTKTLEEEGIIIQYVDEPSMLQNNYDVVVYTPAIPKENKILIHFINNKFNVIKRSDLLQLVSRDTFNICIAGTHGKTTVSTMLAHILRHSGYGCNAFLGGISSNYNTNFWSNPRSVCVIEADEYDRSFLKLIPDVIGITSMDPDHLDIYGTAKEMEDGFIAFTQKLKPSGLLITKKGLAREADFNKIKHSTYHLNNAAANVYATDLSIVNGAYLFNVVGNQWQINNVRLTMGGMHNVENGLLAISIAKNLGIENEKIISAIDTFKGVKRRFEFIVKSEKQIYIDDYAHHPEELRALINGVRNLYPEKKCTIIFQPHLYTRTRDLAKDFAESLDLADEIWLLPIYPARELPIPGVESNIMSAKMKKKVVHLDRSEVISKIKTELPELIITAGAGDIDKLIEPIKEILSA
jgi:UDP-N-acetylmuramate--alanine ligase